ncbi:MAG: M23 family metallopeptidase [Chloroflexi bacterium]|nr:M23 family metallopeptidase [Chloroflexota bacterium]
MFTKNIKSLSLLLTFLFTLLVVSSMTAFVSETPITRNTEGEWITYTDPRFDFTIEYPASWTLQPRKDNPDAIGERIIIAKPLISNDETSSQKIHIEIGLYIAERGVSQDLADWSNIYDENHDEFDSGKILVLNADKRSQADKNIFYKEAISPLTPYTYINIPHGQVVWSIWMNSINEQDQAVIEHIANSMRFSKGSPRSLKQAYGNNFVPQPLIPQNESNSNVIWNSGTSLISASISNYRVPVTVWGGIKCGSINAPVCGGTHSGGAAKAIDISVHYKNVYAAATSNYYGSQWSNSGYGNLVKLQDTQNSYVAYYAHLSWFVVYPSVPLGQGHFIGVSGESGSPGNEHLHFHVQTTGGSPINLSGMTGLTLNSSFPNCGTDCAGIKALPFKECDCGSVN